MANPTPPSKGQDALAALAGAVPGIIARLTSGNNTPPELQQLLSQQVNRSALQNPLFQAASNQAFNGLPSSARQGLSMSSTPLSSAPSPASGGGGGLGALGAGALGALAGAGAGSALPLNKLVDLLKKLFGHGTGQTYGPTNPGPYYGPTDTGSAEGGANPFDVGSLMDLFPNGWDQPAPPPAPVPNVTTDISFPGLDTYGPQQPTEPDPSDNAASLSGPWGWY